ncbi:MAG: hypothetical protein WD598_06270 [Acidimicrobiia bacterium]
MSLDADFVVAADDVRLADFEATRLVVVFFVVDFLADFFIGFLTDFLDVVVAIACTPSVLRCDGI